MNHTAVNVLVLTFYSRGRTRYHRRTVRIFLPRRLHPNCPILEPVREGSRHCSTWHEGYYFQGEAQLEASHIESARL